MIHFKPKMIGNLTECAFFSTLRQRLTAFAAIARAVGLRVHTQRYYLNTPGPKLLAMWRQAQRTCRPRRPHRYVSATIDEANCGTARLITQRKPAPHGWPPTKQNRLAQQAVSSGVRKPYLAALRAAALGPTIALKLAPGVNLGTVAAGILIAAPEQRSCRCWRSAWRT